MKKLVFIDFDGTMYDNRNKKVLDSTRESIYKMSQNPDIILGIATGRSLQTLGLISELLPLFKIKVLINGSFVTYNDEIIYENPLVKADLLSLTNYLKSEAVAYGMITEHHSIVSEYNQEVRDAFLDFGLPLPNKYQEITDDDVYQLWVFGAKTRNSELQAKFPNVRFVNWSFNGMDVLNKKSSKAEGIRAVCKILKYDQIFAFGDGLNDIEMFQLADISVAMGQGSEKLKEVSTFVTDTIDQDGLKKALLFYKLI